MTRPSLSRRSFGLAAGLLGTGVAARARPAEVVLDDPLRLWADLRGACSGPEGSRRRVEGQMLALDTHGRMQRFADVAGVARVRLEPLTTGWRVRHEETLDLLDPPSGAALRVFRNPFTGALVTAQRLKMETTYEVSGADQLTCRTEGDAVAVEEAPHGFGEALSGGSEVLTLRTSAGAPGRAGADVSGHFVRTLAWPAWMAMPHAPPCLMVGRLLSDSRFGATGTAGAEG